MISVYLLLDQDCFLMRKGDNNLSGRDGVASGRWAMLIAIA